MKNINSIIHGLNNTGNAALAKAVRNAIAINSADDRLNTLIKGLKLLGFKHHEIYDDSASDTIELSYFIKATPLNKRMRTKRVSMMTKLVVHTEADITIFKNKIIFILTK